MARRRKAGVTLPEGVEKKTVRKRGKVYTYYYWNPHRGTDREGERIQLPNVDTSPRAFYAELERRQTEGPIKYPLGSVGDLIGRYRNSDEFIRLSDASKANYGVHMRRFEAPEGWGLLPARSLMPVGVQAARDAMKQTPVQANHMLSFGRTVWNWAIPLGLANTNPFDKIKDFDIPDRGHVPWPSWVVDYVQTHATPDLVRMMQLGIMTCQRGSDLIRMGPEHRHDKGIWCRPKKTRKRRRSFLIPLRTADAIALDRWAETPVRFTNSRWLQPIDRFREDLYLYSPKGVPYTTGSLRARWDRWLALTEEGKVLCKRWKEWVAVQAKKYEWDIDPDDANHPTIHGLRGTGLLARAEQGYEVDQIANDIGMSRKNVEHYMRFKDQMKVAVDGQKKLRVVSNED